MKIRGIVLILAFCVVAKLSLSHNKPDSLRVYNSAFAAGERVAYVISYSWLFLWTDVGMVTFSVDNDKRFGQSLLHLKATGATFPFYDWFFKVRDLYESWVQPVSLRPHYYNRKIYEGGYTKENEYFFDWKTNRVAIRIRRKGGANRYDTLTVTPGVYDVVTAIYVARNFDFSSVKPGASFPVKALMDEEVYHVAYRFLGREEIRLQRNERFRCLKFQVDLVAGDIFSGDQKLLVWVTDDKNKLPVYIESPIKVGSIKAKLVSSRGLRYPLDAKIR